MTESDNDVSKLTEEERAIKFDKHINLKVEAVSKEDFCNC